MTDWKIESDKFHFILNRIKKKKHSDFLIYVSLKYLTHRYKYYWFETLFGNTYVINEQQFYWCYSKNVNTKQSYEPWKKHYKKYATVGMRVSADVPSTLYQIVVLYIMTTASIADAVWTVSNGFGSRTLNVRLWEFEMRASKYV